MFFIQRFRVSASTAYVNYAGIKSVARRIDLVVLFASELYVLINNMTERHRLITTPTTFVVRTGSAIGMFALRAGHNGESNT